MGFGLLRLIIMVYSKLLDVTHLGKFVPFLMFISIFFLKLINKTSTYSFKACFCSNVGHDHLESFRPLDIV